MKISKLIYPVVMLSPLMLAGCADTGIDDYQVEKPQTIAEYEYLNAYEPLKTYVDRSAHPNFKVSGALTAADFNKQEMLFRLAAHNFDEIVAGNAMKMSSCVDGDGNMNFSTVSDFVDKAEEAGISIYGHTLAWHAQQPKKWLEGLMKDKEIEVDPDAKVGKVDYESNYEGLSAFPFYVMGYTPTIVNNCLHSENPGSWYQYFIADGFSVAKAGDYSAIVKCKATEEGSLTLNCGWGWNGDESASGKLNITTDWSDVEVKFTGIPEGKKLNLVLQPGGFAGVIDIESIRFVHYEAPAVEIPQNVYTCTFDDGNNVGGWGGTSTREVVSGGHDGGKCHVVHNPTAGNSWECQAAIDFSTPLEKGETYYLHFWAKATNAGSRSASYQNPSDYSGRGDYPAFAVSSEWKEYTLKTSITGDDCKRLCFNLGAFDGDTYLDDIEIYYMKKGNSIPLTDQEKKDTLTWAMDKWIGGMMDACKGKVKAWDVVNEAISGGGNDGEGFYTLQHGEAANNDNGVSADFFWQDYLGDIDYVRTAVALARKHYAASLPEGADASDLKLFVNDYNLESNWDDNKKVKSLINWVKKWEADGVTKIDGLGTQMHISLLVGDDEAAKAEQESRNQHIENMFKLMAESGKLVRVSELDLGVERYVDGKKVAYTTEELEKLPLKERLAIEKAMAAHYQWIIKKYYEIVPAAQQYGICQWCLTDSPANSSWRKGEPVGLWTLDYKRKPAYAGWADGLSNK
ncbi:MAG: endo-1,4-beta-xylanase [Bacteroidaceae bacterium]|nr:endo-1,4-beta-xylanase [Bacteroidaceae bacterium]